MRLGSSGSNNGVIDWSQIRTVDDLENIVGDALYDESDDSPDAGAFGDIEIADGLTPYEIADAERWARFTRGVMLITGVPGSGKTALMNILAWKFRRYFRRRVILDSKPRRIFGPYVYYTHEFLYEMAERLRLYTGINTKSGHDAKHWYTERGEIFLRRAVIGLDEIKRYLPSDTPNDSVCQMWLSLMTIWRHLDSVIIGCCTKKEDITSHCYPEITAEVKCTALVGIPGAYKAVIYPLRYNAGTMVFNVVSKPIMVITNVLEPIPADRHPSLAGYRWCDLYNSWNAQSIRVPQAFQKRIMKSQKGVGR